MDCILLHGWGVTNSVWDGLIPRLSGFDNILSPCLYDVCKKSKNKEFDSVAEALNETIKKDCTLIAWSLGGLLALRLMPLTIKIKSVIFIASTPCFINREKWPNAINRNHFDELKERFSINMGDTLKYFAGLVAHGDTYASSTNKIIQQYLAKEKHNDALSFWLDELETSVQRNWFMTTKVPLHVILGQNDILVKSKIKNQLEELNTNMQCSIIKNCGHAPFISKPKETCSLIYKFLDERV